MATEMVVGVILMVALISVDFSTSTEKDIDYLFHGTSKQSSLLALLND